MAKLEYNGGRIIIKADYKEYTLENGYNFTLYIGKRLSESKLWNIIFSVARLDIKTHKRIVGETHFNVNEIDKLDNDPCYYLHFSIHDELWMKYNPETGIITMHHDYIGY